MAGALLTDLYELNMAASYLRRGMTGEATFSLFARRLPEGRGFLIAAGLEDCLAFLEPFSFTSGDLAYLRRTQDYGEATLEQFARLRFTGDVWAVPEGTAVFATEPLLEVTAPIAEAQLAETALLNHITFQTSVATKAARCAGRGRGTAGGLRVPPHPGNRRRAGGGPRLGDRRLFRDQQRRGGPPLRPDRGGDHGALVHRGIRRRTSRVHRLRRGLSDASLQRARDRPPLPERSGGSIEVR